MSNIILLLTSQTALAPHYVLFLFLPLMCLHKFIEEHHSSFCQLAQFPMKFPSHPIDLIMYELSDLVAAGSYLIMFRNISNIYFLLSDAKVFAKIFRKLNGLTFRCLKSPNRS